MTNCNQRVSHNMLYRALPAAETHSPVTRWYCQQTLCCNITTFRLPCPNLTAASVQHDSEHLHQVILHTHCACKLTSRSTTSSTTYQKYKSIQWQGWGLLLDHLHLQARYIINMVHHVAALMCSRTTSKEPTLPTRPVSGYLFHQIMISTLLCTWL